MTPKPLLTTLALPKPPSPLSLRPLTTTTTPLPPSPRPPTYTKRPPPYPYGPAHHYKQSDSGLYGASTIQFGNKVSEKNALKSRRSWHPNIHNKRLWSDALGRFVQVKVQARVLRTMDKCGGLDGYLMGEKPGRIKELGVEGWRLRWMVMRTGKVRRRIQGQKEALGLVEPKKTTKTEDAQADPLEEQVTQTTNTIITRLGAQKPSSEPSPLLSLESRLNLTTQSIQAETARRAQKAQGASFSSSFPPHSDEPQVIAARVPISKLKEQVEAEIAATEGEKSERLVEAMERLRKASEELEIVKAAAAAEGAENKAKGRRMGMGMEKEAEGGILGKIKGFFGRR